MKKALGGIFNGLIIFFLYAPLLVMMFFSFNESKSTAVFTGFSLKWYEELFRNDNIIEAFQNTLLIAVLSAVIATVLGTVAAVGLYRMRTKWVKNISIGVVNIPMLNPDIITGISMMLLFVFAGRFLAESSSLGFGTILIAHITFNLPYVILNVMPKLRQTDPHLVEAAQDLGCHPLSAFFKTTLPQIVPGIFSGFLMSLTLSVDDFVITKFVGGTSFTTLPMIIYSSSRKGVPPDIYALSSLIFVVILVLLVVTNLIGAKSENKN